MDHTATNSTTATAAAGQAEATTQQQAFTIVGGGRVGQALSEMGSGQDVILGRGQPIEGPPGPIVVCTDRKSVV